MSWDLIFQHLFIVLAASLLSIAVGLPLGIWAYVSKTARPVILRIVDLLQTIPSLALLGIIMVVLDPGKLTVITGITLYSLLPIVRNTCLGLQEVDPGREGSRPGHGHEQALPGADGGVPPGLPHGVHRHPHRGGKRHRHCGIRGLRGRRRSGRRHHPGHPDLRTCRSLLAATGVLMVIAVVLDLIMSWFEGQMRKSRGGSRKMWIPVGGTSLLAFMPAAALWPRRQRRS